MKNLIAYCGIDCERCEARIATLNNDQEAKERIARSWAELNNAPITAEHINCVGCRTMGAKTVYCSEMCIIRKCALGKGYETCGDCVEMDSCEKIAPIIQFNSEARGNLLSI